MKIRAAALALLAVAGMASAAETQKVAPAKLDPASAYVLVRLGERSPGLWNLFSISAYDAVNEDIRGKGRSKANPVPKGVDRAVLIGPKNYLLEQAHVRTYLTAITPGRYVIASSPTTCFCLGSYQFEAAAGTITDLGTLYMGPENGTSSWGDLSPLRSSPDIEERGYTIADAMAIYPAGAQTVRPQELRALPAVAAQYLVAKRFGNHGGQLLNRALPIKGVQ
jgi:hypothetical protein